MPSECTGPETIIAISSVVIALCALVVTIWQSYLARKHNRLSVNPHGVIEVNISRNSDQVGLRIRNQGIGPMLVTSICIQKDGMCFNFDDASIVDKFTYLSGGCFVFRICSGELSVLPNEDVWIISTTRHKEDEQLILDLKRTLSFSSVELKYESIYREKYTSSFTVEDLSNS